MRTFSLIVRRVVARVWVLAALATGPAYAFDPDGSQAYAGPDASSSPHDLLRLGLTAYRQGKKDDALEAYRNAAEQGHPGARWAIASMYATGDGVAENDYEAFKMFERIAREGVEPGSTHTGYFVDALVSLAGYHRRGIPGSPVRPDPARARQLYFQAASTFGMAEAQFQLGRMMLAGEGGEADLRQAKKWLNRARKTGHSGATALFGDTMVQEGHTVRGLAYMTVALHRAGAGEREWIRAIRARAFSRADERDRHLALTLAEDMLAVEGR